jgi:hypothetical protein
MRLDGDGLRKFQGVGEHLFEAHNLLEPALKRVENAKKVNEF